MPACIACMWFSDGISCPQGSGWCHSTCDYVHPDGYCAFWEEKHRRNPSTGEKIEPLDPGPMTPEQMLRAQVACFDADDEA